MIVKVFITDRKMGYGRIIHYDLVKSTYKVYLRQKLLFDSEVAPKDRVRPDHKHSLASLEKITWGRILTNSSQICELRKEHG